MRPIVHSSIARWAARGFFATMIVAGVAGLSASAVAAEPRRVVVAKIEGAINPITARYVDRVVEAAERDPRVVVVVFAIDTPGGLIDSTYKITGRFLSARVPIVTYVAPAGSRAASAGAFITLAGHVAAMAPTTNIGAAHPVDSSGGDIQGDLRLKAENDAVARIRGIAEARGRNASWAEDAVRKSVSIGVTEAVRIGVVDLAANDIADLLAKLDGRTVRLPQGEVTLQTAGAALDDDGPNLLETLLHLVVDPQIAVLLFTLGTYGLIFELQSPGLILPGIVGVIAIVLALFAFGTLDANAAGIALMLFAVALFALEIKVVSHGLLTVGAIVSLVIGTIVVFPPVRPTFPGFRASVDPVVIAVIVGVTALFFGTAARAAVSFRSLPVHSGTGLLVGAIGTVKRDLAPRGIIRVGDDDWTAVTLAAHIPSGARVRVRRVDGVRLYVEPESDSGRKDS